MERQWHTLYLPDSICSVASCVAARCFYVDYFGLLTNGFGSMGSGCFTEEELNCLA